MPRTPAEILAELNALDGDDFEKAVSAIINDSGNVVAKARAKIVKAAKTEGAKDLPKLEQRAIDAEEERDRLAGEIEELKKAAPDFAKREADLKASYDKKLADEKAKASQAEEKLRGKDRDVLTVKFEQALTGTHKVHPRIARDARREFADRFDVAGETPRILKFKETTPYDAETVDDQIALLAADVAKTIEPEFILAGGDQGGGRGSGGSGNLGKPSVDDLVAQKRNDSRYRNIV